jgi:hypothetical protein
MFGDSLPRATPAWLVACSCCCAGAPWACWTGTDDSTADDAAVPVDPAGTPADRPPRPTADASKGERNSEVPAAAGIAGFDGVEVDRDPPGGSRTDASDATPVTLDDIEIELRAGGGPGAALEIRAQGRLNDKIDSATYVQAKARCKSGPHVLADTGFVNADFRKPLQDHGVGESAGLSGSFFSQGVETIQAPCEIEFHLAGASDGPSKPIAFACHDGEATRATPCPRPLVSPPTAGGPPLRVHDLGIALPGLLGARGGLNAHYILEIREPQDAGTRITLKATCRVDDLQLVDISVANLTAGPFRFEPGESVARSAPLFFDPSFPFTAPPDSCDLQVAMWRHEQPGFDDGTRLPLHRACWREGAVHDGPCSAPATPPDPRGPLTAGALRVEGVAMEVVEPYGSKGDRFQLKVQADATIERPVDPFSSINASITCKVGKTVRVETTYLHGVDLHYLEPGETTRLRGTSFTSAPMERPPTSCEAEFSSGRRFSAAAQEDTLLGKWCLSGATTKRGKC